MIKRCMCCSLLSKYFMLDNCTLAAAFFQAAGHSPCACDRCHVDRQLQLQLMRVFT